MGGELEITRSDMEMAATYYSSRVFGQGKQAELMRLYKMMAEGDCDALSLLFAKHRIAHAPQPHTNEKEAE